MTVFNLHAGEGWKLKLLHVGLDVNTKVRYNQLSMPLPVTRSMDTLTRWVPQSYLGNEIQPLLPPKL